MRSSLRGGVVGVVLFFALGLVSAGAPLASAAAAGSAAVRLGDRRLEAVVGADLLVSARDGTSLALLAQNDGTVRRRLPLPAGRAVTGVAVLIDGTTAWLDTGSAEDFSQPELLHLDLETGAVLSRTVWDAAPEDAMHYAPVGIDRSWLWVVAGSLYDQEATLLRIDQADGRVLRSIPLPHGWGSTAVAADGTAWIFASDGVARVGPDATDVEPMGRIPHLEFVDRAVTAGAVMWLTAGDEIVRYDPMAGRAMKRVHLGDALQDTAYGLDHLWVTNSRRLVDDRSNDVGRDHNRVYEVDATTGRRLRTYGLSDLEFDGGTDYTDYPRPRVRTDGVTVWVAHAGVATRLAAATP